MTTIALTAHSRPAYLEESLASWRQAMDPDHDDLLIVCEPGFPDVERVAHSAEEWARCTVRVNEKRAGALGNPWIAIEWGFDTGASFVMLGEDDSIVSTDVLRYVDWARTSLQLREEIAWVCAFNAEPACDGAPHAAYLGPFASTVWGTWRDRWNDLLRDTWQFAYQPFGGWDWYFQREIVAREGRKAVRPALSRSLHIGREGGTHCSTALFDAGGQPAGRSDLFVADPPAGTWRLCEEEETA